MLKIIPNIIKKRCFVFTKILEVYSYVGIFNKIASGVLYD